MKSVCEFLMTDIKKLFEDLSKETTEIQAFKEVEFYCKGMIHFAFISQNITEFQKKEITEYTKSFANSIDSEQKKERRSPTKSWKW